MASLALGGREVSGGVGLRQNSRAKRTSSPSIAPLDQASTGPSEQFTWAQFSFTTLTLRGFTHLEI